uniref:Uncharacterized protein n=1 Tax=Anguilla anguilla TaxID=7936 RepID=A0A0E9RY38_ANGAN
MAHNRYLIFVSLTICCFYLCCGKCLALWSSKYNYSAFQMIPHTIMLNISRYDYMMGQSVH